MAGKKTAKTVKTDKTDDKVLVLVHSTVDTTYAVYTDKGTTLRKFVDGLIADGKVPDEDWIDGCASVENADGSSTEAGNHKLVPGDVVTIESSGIDMENVDREFEKNMKLYAEGKLDRKTDGGFSDRIEKITPELLEKLSRPIEDDSDDDEDDPVEDVDCYGSDGVCGCGCCAAEADNDVAEIDEAACMLSDFLERRGSSVGTLTVSVDNGQPVEFSIRYKQ